jgi:hypothetical protein
MGVMVVPAAEGVGSCFTGLQRASTVGLRPAGGHGGPLDAKLAAALFPSRSAADVQGEILICRPVPQ